MKTLFIEGKYSEKVILPDQVLGRISNYKQIALCTTIQFIDSLEWIKKQLEQKNVDVVFLQGSHSTKNGQILGCDVPEIDKKINCVLFVGDGMFHPKSLFLRNKIDVFAFNPFTKQMMQISDSDVKDFERLRKAGISKFHSSTNIGVIISTKPGQSIDERKVKSLETKFNDKKFYKFVSDTIDFNQLENFQFIECWVNTACPRIGYDDARHLEKAIVNIEDMS